MERSLEVDANYSSVAASWFPELTESVNKKKTQDPIEQEKKSTESAGKLKKPNKVVKKVESTGGNDRQQQGPVLSDFIGSKLTKKLAKGERKRKAVQDNDKAGHISNIDTNVDEDISEDSKTASIQSCKRTKLDLPEKSSQDKLEELNKKLKDPSINKNARKKLRKKIKLLLESENKGITNSLQEEDASPSLESHEKLPPSDKKGGTTNVNKTSKKVKPSNVKVCEELEKNMEKSKKGKDNKKTCAESECKQQNDEGSDSEQNQNIESDTTKNDSEGQKKKRKRKKKRSKQKNIRKDHRPAHMKPQHRPNPCSAKVG